MRVEQASAAAGVVVQWRPFHLRTITTERNNRPFIGKPVKLMYRWRDMERRAHQHRIPFNGVPPYPVDADGLAHRVGTVASVEDWCPEYSKALYHQWFIEHQGPGETEQMRLLLSSLGRVPTLSSRVPTRKRCERAWRLKRTWLGASESSVGRRLRSTGKSSGEMIASRLRSNGVGDSR